MENLCDYYQRPIKVGLHIVEGTEMKVYNFRNIANCLKVKMVSL